MQAHRVNMSIDSLRQPSAIPLRVRARVMLHSQRSLVMRGRAERRVPDAPMGLCA